jgi:hypothetical protein
MTTYIDKAPIGEQDFNKYDGVASTFTRGTSAGGTETITKFGYEVDALMVYGGGVNYTDTTINLALAAIGTTTKVMILLRPGTWVFSSSRNWSAYTNVVFRIPYGAIISHGLYTLQIYNAPDAGAYQIFTGAGAVTITGYPQDQAWFGSAERLDATGFYTAGTVQAGVGTFASATVGGVDVSTFALVDNYSFTASVGSNQLTVSLKGSNGNNPSATNVVSLKFRSSTLTDGKPYTRTVASALSFILTAGSTLGFTANETGRIYLWALDNAGTVALGVSRTTDIFPEYSLITTTAEGGAGGADSATTLYSSSLLTGVSIKCLGYIIIRTGATAGYWDSAPTKLQLMLQGIKRTGDIIQIKRYDSGALFTSTASIPSDDTIPQNTEGAQWATLSITPTSVVNIIEIEVITQVADVNAPCIALFQDSTANALAVAATGSYGGQGLKTLVINYTMVAATEVSTTYKVRLGNTSTGSTYINGITTRLFGGVCFSSIIIKEIMA